MKSVLLPYFENQCKSNSNILPTDWFCDVNTSYLESDPKLLEYKNTYTENIIEFLSCINFPKCQIEVLDPWYNLYCKGQYQEIHHHSYVPNTYFSAVHFLKYNPKFHKPLVVHNHNRVFTDMFTLGKSSNMNYWDSQHVIDVEEGDIVIFPSTLEHYVQPQTTEEYRVTISFNIKALPISTI
jgi:hypothetical protein